MPDWLAPTAIGGGLSLVDALLSGDSDQEKMRKRLLKEYDEGEFGYSPEEKRGLRFGLGNRLKNFATSSNKAASASAARRGQAWNPQAITETIGKAGQAYAGGLVDIDVASEEQARKRKLELEKALLGYASTDEGGLGGGIGDLAGNIMQMELLKKKKKPDEGSYTNFPGGLGY